MKITSFSVPALILGVACGAFAQAGPAKVGIINIQSAIAATKDGQKAAADMEAKFKPTRDRLTKKQADIEADKTKLNSGSNAMGADVKDKLMRDIDVKTKALNRDAEDAQAEVDAESGRIMQELGGRMMAVINKYGKDKGYGLILDVNQQSPVLYAPDDITEDIVKLYDANSPGTSAPASSARPAATTPSPASAAPRPAPATPSPVKKAPGAKQ